MSAMTDAFEVALLTHLMIDQTEISGGGKPTSGDLVLFTTLPDDAGDGGVEAPIAAETLALDSATWDLTGTLITNDDQIVTANASSGCTVLGWGMKFGGVLWIAAPLVAPVEVGNGEPFTFEVGDLRFQFGGSLTDWAAAAIAGWFFRGASLTWPSAFEWSLTTTTPTAAAAGTEQAGGGYSRPVIDNDASEYSLAGSEAVSVADRDWGTADEDWVNSVGTEAYDGSGNRWLFDPAPDPVPCTSGGKVVASAGQVRVSAS